MNFEKYFESLKYFQKIEIYILVILFFSGLVWFFEEHLYNNKEDNQKLNQKILFLKKQKAKKVEDIKILNFIEKQTSKFDIENKIIKIEKNEIYFKFQGDSSNVINSLNDIFKTLDLKKFKVYKGRLKKQIICEIVVKKSGVFLEIKNYKKLEDKVFPFFEINYKKALKKKVKKKELILKAIVSKEALICDKWVGEGSFINDYKIDMIGKNFVKVKNQKKEEERVLYLNEK